MLVGFFSSVSSPELFESEKECPLLFPRKQEARGASAANGSGLQAGTHAGTQRTQW